MKKLIFLIGIVIILGISCAVIAYRPYEMYQKIIFESKYNDYFSINRKSDGLVKSYPIVAQTGGKVDASVYDPLWERLHIRYIVLPLPVKHPSFKLVPIVNFNGAEKYPDLGIDVIDIAGESALKVLPLGKEQFFLKKRGQQLFKIPFFEELLKNKTYQEIWVDVFSKDLTLWKVPVKDLVYNLYLLYLRSIYVPKSFDSYFFDPRVNRGIISLKTLNVNKRKEIVYELKGKMIYSYMLITQRADPEILRMRYRILKESTIEDYVEDNSKQVYQKFKDLRYDQQISSTGMIYLFSAWSLNLKSKNFLKEMIHFLERGKDNFLSLRPLYAYARKKYHTTFSKIQADFEETAAQKLKRKVEQELEEEVRKEKMTDNEIDNEESMFKNSQEKVEYLLNRAKEDGLDTDQDESILRYD